MTVMRKWIAFLLLAAFLPATAFAQVCATRCAFMPSAQQAVQMPATQHEMPAMGEHCNGEKSADTCPFAAVCDFANLFVLNVVAIQFAVAPLFAPPSAFLADFMSVTYPPALRPPTV